MGKKVLYFHCGGDTIGGIETFMYYSINYHKRYKPLIVFIKDGKFPQFLKGKNFQDIYFLNGGRIRDLVKSSKAIFNGIRLLKYLQPDIIIGQGSYSWFYAGLILKFIKSKSLFYMHGPIRKRNLTWIDKISLRYKPTAYIANSQLTANTISNYFKNAKIFLNYPGVDKNIFNNFNEEDCREKIINEFNLPKESIILLIAGRIQECKGQDIGIKAFNLISNSYKEAYLLILGEPTFDEDYNFLEKLKKLAKDYKLEDRIKFVGHRMDVEIFFKAANIILHTTKEEEAFGLTVVEAMLCKKPIIATKSGGPEEIINHGTDGFLVKRNDYEEMAFFINELIKNKQLSLRIAENAYLKARENFTSEKSIENLENIIESVLSLPS